MAVSHGYLSAKVKGYAEKRRRIMSRLMERQMSRPDAGKANLSGWEKLAELFPGPVQHGGERLVD
jgi:hypothetical protein